MILKVKTEHNDWKYYEGFYEAEVQKICEPVGIECDEYHKSPFKDSMSMGAAKKPIVVVTVSYPNKQRIAFETEGYLLNYEGKTIEKL